MATTRQGDPRVRIVRTSRRLLTMVVAVLLAMTGLAVVAPSAHAAGTTFITTWKTDNAGASAANQIRLPLTSSGSYNFVVDWGDGSTDTITAHNQPEATHTYSSAGTKTVRITGSIRGWRFGNGGDRLKLLDIGAWGPLQLGNDGGYFWGAANLGISATDAPDLGSTSNLSNIFLNATALNADLSDWDLSGVTNLTGAFRGATSFNGDIAGWDVSAVTNMTGMFRGATAFNGDISGWDVSAVTNMSSLFRDADSFNRNLATWDITAVGDMAAMFQGAGVSRANYDALLIGWAERDVQLNVDFDAGSSKYTQGPASTAHDVLTDDNLWTIIDGGETSEPDAPTGVNATRSDGGATATWNAAIDNNNPILEYVATISPAPNAGSATCAVVPPAARSCTWSNLTNGDTYTITVTARNEVGTSPASSGADVVPQVDVPNAPGRPTALALDTKATVTWAAPSGGGTPISYTATAIPGGQTCEVTAPAQSCDVTGLTNGTNYTFTVSATNPGGTSAESLASNSVTPGPVFATTWDTRNTTTGSSGASRIRLPLVADGTYDFVIAWGDGTVSNIITSDVDPDNLNAITHSYSEQGVKNITITGTINGWNLRDGVAGAFERNKLTGVTTWGPLRLGTPSTQGHYFADAENLSVTATDELDLTGTSSLAGAFAGAALFNGDVSSWDVAAVTDFSETFADANSFNQDVGGWNTGNVTTMAGMFAGATAFNHDLSGWDTGSLTDIEGMFAGATAFNGGVASLVTPSVTSTSDLFNGATAFNQDVSAWDVSAVTDASGTFAGATSFNQDLSGWNTEAMTNMTDMFSGASAFNQDLSSWDFEAVTRFGDFLTGTSLGIHNYNLLLARLAAQNVQPDLSEGATEADRTMGFAPAQYSVGPPTTARDTLVGRGFTITDGGQTNQNIPDAPTGVLPTSASGNTATVTWVAPNDNNSDIVGYTVVAQHKTDPDTYPDLVCESATTECLFDNTLDSGYENYLFIVTATNEVGTSAPSATAAPDTPAAPTVVAGDGKVSVTITPPTEGAAPSSYTVTASPGDAECTITVPGTSCDITGLTNGVTYTVTAVASNWVGPSAASPPSDPVIPGKVFATTWRTSNTSAGSSNANQIRLPLPAGGTYDFYVSWGDGDTDRITAHDDPEVTHTYAQAGTKSVSITGDITGWRFNSQGDRLKLLSISSWGPLRLGSNGGYFYGAANLTVTATDVLDLTGTTSLFNAFFGATAFNGSVADWDVSAVTDMTNAFRGASAFTGTGLTSWDVGSVQQFDSTFEGSGVTADISGWATSSALDLNRMFADAGAFNQPLGGWDVGAVEDLSGMFAGATTFNQDLAAWDTSSVTDMSQLFQGSAIDPTRSFAGWDIDQVTIFEDMFRNNPNLAGTAAVPWYNALLIGWEAQIDADADVVLTVCGAANTSGNSCGEGAPQYSTGPAADARQDLIDRGWVIADGGPSDLNVPDQIVDVETQESVFDSTDISWPVPAANGSDITGYTVYAVSRADHDDRTECASGSEPIATCAFSTTDFLFSVTATNAIGTSTPSEIEAPGAPGKPVATAGSGRIAVEIVPPTTGGAPTSYTVTPDDPGVDPCAITVPATECVFTGLDNGTAYTFTATATNWLGTSSASPESDPTSPQNVFATTWRTGNTSTGSTGSRRIRLPLVPGGDYDFVVKWGDGTSDVITSHDQPEVTHEYDTRGTKHITISGDIEGWSFDGGGDRLKLVEISNWGNLRLGNAGGAFHGAANLVVSATDALNLAGTTDLHDTFRGATLFNGDVTGWQTGAVTDMSGMFAGAASFDQDLSAWDTSSVTTMRQMFKGSAFTGAVSGWDITSVTDFVGMFQDIPPMTGASFINWYGRLLVSWSAQQVHEGAVGFTACGAVDSDTECADGLKYYGQAAIDARQSLVDRGWQIVDGGVAAANVPEPPTVVSLDRDGTEATVTWDPAVDNGSPITGYSVVADLDDRSCTATGEETSCTLTGLSADEDVKFSVMATATNALGSSDQSQPFPVLRPGTPGTPTAVPADSSAFVTVVPPNSGGPASSYSVVADPGGQTCAITLPADPLTCQVVGLTNGSNYTFTAVAANDGGYSGASPASATVSPRAAALTPEFADPIPTGEGFTVQITNYDAAFTWEGTATEGGTVDVSNTGLVTVTGVDPVTTSAATITTQRLGFIEGSAIVEATSLQVALTPAFGTTTPTADGFTVQVTNYNGHYRWDGTATNSGLVEISDSGLVTVSNVAPATNSVATITTERDGYVSGRETVDDTSLQAALTPAFGSVTRTATGFTVPVTNFAANQDFTWDIGSVTPAGSAELDENGLVTVTGVAPGASATVTVTTVQAGYASGSNSETDNALDAPLVPDFEPEIPTPDGFTAQITNYDPAFEWAGTATEGGDVEISDTGLVTVTGVDPDTESVATVTTVREGYVDGSAPARAYSLKAPLIPEFGVENPGAHGFTVQITNFDTDERAFTFAVVAVTPTGAHATIDEDGLVTVTDVPSGTATSVTISSTRAGYAPGQDTSSTTSTIGEPLIPEFDEDSRTATADGFTAQITNYDNAFDWAGTTTAGGTVDVSDTGLVTVSGLAANTPSTATVTTTRDGYEDGSGTVAFKSLQAPLTPTFADPTRTATGFTVQITNFDTPGFTFTVADPTPQGSAEVNETGLVMVTGLAAGTEATVTVSASRADYVTGTADANARSLDAALTPDIDDADATADGFTAQITNFDAAFDWSGTATAGGVVSIDGAGLITVTGLAPHTESIATIETQRDGYVPGSNTVPGTSLREALVFDLDAGSVVRTADGFTVQVTGFDGDFQWSGTATASGSVAVSDSGLVTVTGVAPDTVSEVTVAAAQAGYVTGTDSVSGRSLKAALIPQFGEVTRTATGFTVPVTNFSPTDDFTWSVSAPEATAELNQLTGLVTVSGVEADTLQQATVTSTQAGFADGAAEVSGRSLAAAHDPEFGSVTRTPDGFTVPLTNFSPTDGFTWAIEGVTSGGSASLDQDSGVVTVTGLAAGVEAIVTVSAVRTGYVDGQGSENGTALEAALVFDLDAGSVVRTADGFTVQVTGFDDDFQWSGTATASGSVAVSGSGLVTVTGVAPDTVSEVTVAAAQAGYVTGTDSVSGRSLKAAEVPEFGAVTRTATGFTVPVTNFAPDDDFTWAISEVSAGQAELDQGTGVVTVTGLGADSPATVQVTTTQAGFADGVDDVTGRSLVAARDPQFGAVTRTAAGFTVPVTNFGPNDDFTWAVEGVTVGSAELDQDSGVVTVTGLAAGQEATVTVSAKQAGYVDGQGSQNGTALNAALTPQFGTPTRTADGFTVAITNHDPAFNWSGSATASGQVAVSGSGVVTVSGIAPDTESEVTIGTARNGYVAGSASTTGSSLKAARTPQFAAVNRTADGYTVRITNYDGDFDWSASATNTTDDVDIASGGTVTVTGMAPGANSILTVRAVRDGYADGRAQVDATSSDGAAVTPEFGPVTRTAAGFTTPITNYSAGFTWTARSSAGQVVISDQTVIVTGLASDQTATVTVTTARSGYGSGSGSVSGTALPATPADQNTAKVPAGPTITKITAKKKGRAAITYTATNNGGSAILGATATCKAKKSGTVTVTGKASPLNLKKLKKKRTYTCTVTVTNAIGVSPASPAKKFKAK